MIARWLVAMILCQGAGELFAIDRIVLKTGDVLNMRVEKFDDKSMYTSDSMNRIVLPMKVIDHVEYQKPRKVVLPGAEGGKEVEWEVSHFVNEDVFLWNRASKKTLSVPRFVVGSAALGKLIPRLWGGYLTVGRLAPNAKFESLLSPGTTYGLMVSHKQEFNVAWLDVFYSLEGMIASYKHPTLEQGLRSWQIMPVMNIVLVGNEYARLFLTYGLGPAGLTTYNEDEKSTDLTGVTWFGVGLEYFMLPYLSMRARYGFSAYLQQTNLDYFTGFAWQIAVGYYFLD